MKAAHLSDLHLGRHTSWVKLEALVRDLRESNPDLIILNGDITDRGTKAQFKWARQILEELGIPFISVPGNREISITAPWEWILPRLAMTRYQRFIGPKDRIVYVSDDHGTVFFGLNSVHPFPSWPGKITRETRYWLREQIAQYPSHFKAIFLHHPVMPVIRSSSFWAHTFSEAGELLNICTQHGVTLILQGHKHRSSVMKVSIAERDTALVVSACGAPLMPFWDSAYHFIHISEDSLTIEPREFAEGSFHRRDRFSFSRGGQSSVHDRESGMVAATTRSAKPARLDSVLLP